MECLNPFYLRGEPTPLPCSKCPACLAKRINSWSFRLTQQDKISISSNFITLTYDNETIPRSPNNFKTLDKRDLQLFFKRLRKSHRSHTKIKYYAVGEYGAETMRPHYHIILFNSDPFSVEKAWQKGYIHNGDVRGASISYTLKYINKKGKIPMHKNDDRQREFSLMSKGLGLNYLTPNMKAWHLAMPAERVYVTIEGRKLAMPRYYRNKLYTSIQLSEYQTYVQNLAHLKKSQYIDDIDYHRNHVEGIKAAYNKMEYHNNLLQNNRI